MAKGGPIASNLSKCSAHGLITLIEPSTHSIEGNRYCRSSSPSGIPIICAKLALPPVHDTRSCDVNIFLDSHNLLCRILSSFDTIWL